MPTVEWSEENAFGGWADEIWEAAKSDYSLVAVRDCDDPQHSLSGQRSPLDPAESKFQGKVVGWAVLLNVPMNGHNYFGNMQRRIAGRLPGSARHGRRSRFRGRSAI